MTVLCYVDGGSRWHRFINGILDYNDSVKAETTSNKMRGLKKFSKWLQGIESRTAVATTKFTDAVEDFDTGTVKLICGNTVMADMILNSVKNESEAEQEAKANAKTSMGYVTGNKFMPRIGLVEK